MTDIIHTPPEGIQIAFFDLDETLTSRDTDLLWALWRSRRSVKGWADLLRLRQINKLYYSHTLTPEEYSRYHLSRARSMSPSQYERMAGTFARFVSKRYIYSQMKDLLASNSKKGILNILITAQDEVIGRALQEELGLDDCIASTYVLEDNRYKGMKTPLCFKEGKVYWAGLYLEQNALSWDICAFYSDSLNDLPLLEACSCPVAVHPGKELEKLSVERSWTILKPS